MVPFGCAIISLLQQAALDQPACAPAPGHVGAHAQVGLLDVDQRADHVRRLREFEASLRTDLAASGKMRNVILDCPPNACSVGDINVAQLVGKAQAAGAAFLVIGRVHKMSTLVQWAKFDIIDVNAQKVVFDRLFSFRGDNDEAWRHAKSFVVREIIDREAMLTRNAESALPRSP